MMNRQAQWVGWRLARCIVTTRRGKMSGVLDARAVGQQRRAGRDSEMVGDGRYSQYDQGVPSIGGGVTVMSGGHRIKR